MKMTNFLVNREQKEKYNFLFADTNKTRYDKCIRPYGVKELNLLVEKSSRRIRTHIFHFQLSFLFYKTYQIQYLSGLEVN